MKTGRAKTTCAPLSPKVYLTERQAKIDGTSFEVVRQKPVDTIAAKRFGRTEEFGDLCAYLCSVQASFVCGQNVQVDGGSYRGPM